MQSLIDAVANNKQVNREEETCSSAETSFLGNVTCCALAKQSNHSFCSIGAFIS